MLTVNGANIETTFTVTKNGTADVEKVTSNSGVTVWEKGGGIAPDTNLLWIKIVDNKLQINLSDITNIGSVIYGGEITFSNNVFSGSTWGRWSYYSGNAMVTLSGVNNTIIPSVTTDNNLDILIYGDALTYDPSTKKFDGFLTFHSWYDTAISDGPIAAHTISATPDGGLYVSYLVSSGGIFDANRVLYLKNGQWTTQ
jgi:hypothetical protein